MTVHLVKDWEDQPRDADGRWGSGGGTTSDVPRDPGLPADHSAGPIAQAVNSGAVMRADPDQVVQLTKEWANNEHPIQLMGLSVNGADNKNLFDHSALGLPRDQMPHLPADAAGINDFAKFLDERGIGYHFEEVDPRSLMATQGELNGAKVGGILSSFEAGKPLSDTNLVVAKGGEVLDGHHRWAAASVYAMAHPGSDPKVGVIRLDTDIKSALDIGHEYADLRGLKPQAFGTKALSSKPPDPGQAYWFIGGQWRLIATDDADGVPREGYGLPLCKPAAKKSRRFFIVKDWSDEERDEQGRWTSGGGSGTASMDDAARHISESAQAFRDAGGTVETITKDQSRDVERELDTLYRGIIAANGGNEPDERIRSGFRLANVAASSARAIDAATIRVARTADGHIAAVCSLTPRPVLDPTHIELGHGVNGDHERGRISADPRGDEGGVGLGPPRHPRSARQGRRGLLAGPARCVGGLPDARRSRGRPRLDLGRYDTAGAGRMTLDTDPDTDDAASSTPSSSTRKARAASTWSRTGRTKSVSRPVSLEAGSSAVGAAEETSTLRWSGSPERTPISVHEPRLWRTTWARPSS